MKPFTSKHCTQYLTKESPLNQGYITKEMRSKTPEEQRASIRRQIDKREKIHGKPKPILEQAAQNIASKLKEQYRPKTGPTGIAPDKRQYEPTNYALKKGSEADEATLKRMSSTKYKK